MYGRNFGPIGTGPFVVTDFRPNDVIQMVANDNYRDPAKPAFASLTFKGGGDATAAGRAVMETANLITHGTYSLRQTLLLVWSKVAKDASRRFGPLVERIMLNQTNPSASLDADTRSTAKASIHS